MPEGHPRAGLGRSVGVIVGALATMVVGVCCALLILTTLLTRGSAELRSAAESIHLVEEAQVALLLHSRNPDPLLRSNLENDARSRLAEASRFVSGPDEQAVFATATVRIEQYFATAGESRANGAELEAAYRALDTFVDVNVAQARATHARALEWDRTAIFVGVGAAALVLVTLAAVVAWMYRHVIRPVLSLADAMERFGRGDSSTRVREQGAPELREMAVRFNGMASALARNEQARLTFVAGVAHDLRNPISALLMATRFIDPERPLADADRMREMLALVRRQIARLDRMVEDLLDATRIRAGHLELHLADQDLRAIARETYELFRDTSPIHTLVFDGGPTALVVRCDALRIEQALNNLVSNAIKYSPEGGEIRVEVHRERDGAVVEVSDRGIGIASAELDRVWEPYQRGPAAAGIASGVGLGLAVTKRIIEAHGGGISVASAPGEGSTFSIRLPLATVQPRTAARTTA